jgi:signal transduction histidine kinase
VTAGQGNLGGAIAQLWARQRDDLVRRVEVIESAIAALRTGGLTQEQRLLAARAAHRIAGAAGSFGFADAARYGRELETALGRGPMPEDVDRLTELVRGIRQKLELGAAEVETFADSFNDMIGEVKTVVDQLHEVEQMKTRFISTVSHELRTPLTSITGYLHLLERGVAGPLTEAQLDFVHVALRNSDRLASLIDDLLTLSRFDAGRVSLDRRRVDLVRQLRDLREEMEPVADEAESRLALETPPELVIEGDPQRLQQSFANLVSNAIKFNRPGGQVRISAAASSREAIVEVSDEGVGIPPAEIPRIGERFFRASTTMNMPGSGLGLAITREIVERHGGRLEIDSQVGKGSSFRIRLPRESG